MKRSKQSRLRYWILVIGASLAWIQQAVAQEATEVSFAGLAGVTTTAPGGEVLLYFVELQELAGGQDATLKTAGAGTEEIRFTITDLSVPTGLVVGDIAALNFYRSADALFDVGDVLQKSIVPGALGALTIPFNGPVIPGPDIPDTPASIFFLLTATIAGGATSGHSFDFAVAGLHIDIRDGAPGPLNYTLGTAILASDANRVDIVAGGGGGGGSGGGGGGGGSVTKIPFGGEWLFALLGLSYGVFVLTRNQLQRAAGRGIKQEGRQEH